MKKVAEELVAVAEMLTADAADYAMEKAARRNGAGMAADAVIQATKLSIEYAERNALGGSKTQLQKKYLEALMDEMVSRLSR